MRKNVGNAIAQYGIIILLIGIACIAIFATLGQNIVQQLVYFKNCLAGNCSASSISTNISSTPNTTAKPTTFTGLGTTPSIIAGDLGGTQDAPVIKNNNDGTVSIDYGSFVLDGIPSDFQDHVQVSGNSGGTETALAMLDSMIAQIEDTADPDDINLLKELSNYGHTIASTEKDIESTANDIGTAEYANITDLESTKNTLQNQIDQLVNVNDVDFASKLQEVIDKYSASSDPGDAKILAVASALSDQIISLSSQINTDSKKIIEQYDNLVTLGEDAQTLDGVYLTDFTEEVINPNSSEITNIDSAIICATGNGKDLGYDCK